MHAEPWEVALGAIVFSYGMNKLVQAEAFYEGMTYKLLAAKMQRNEGVLEEKYVELLGTSYDKIMKYGKSS